MQSYAYFGDEAIGSYVKKRLDAAGFERVDAVDAADAVLTHCIHTGAIEDLYFESEGIIKRAMPGTLLIDLSASTPSQARELSAVATVNDLRFVEAPMAVRDAFLPDALDSAGNLLIFMAGEAEDCAEAEPLLQSLAGQVMRTGASGSAQLSKTMHTIRQSAAIIAAVECNALGDAFEASAPLFEQDAKLAIPCEDSGLYGSAYADMVKCMESKQFDGSFTIAMLMADVAAAMVAADDAELILPQLEAALHILELFGVIGGADKGVGALGLLYRDEHESADAGLDWTRAEGMYQDGGSYGEDDGDYGDYGDDLGFAGGFGDYYSN